MLCVEKLRLIETADSSEWATRAKRQWGNGSKLSIRCMSANNVVLGTSPPQEFSPDSLELCCTGTLDVPVTLDTAHPIVFEVLSHQATSGTVAASSFGSFFSGSAASSPVTSTPVTAAKAKPGSCVRPIAIAHIDLAAMIGSPVRYLWHSVHVYPTLVTEATVHAVLELTLRGPDVDTPPPLYTPLDLLFGAVRTSTMDLYFPSTFCSLPDGSHMVSNVVCVANATDTRRLSLSLDRRMLPAQLRALPVDPVMIAPGQKAFFSITWDPFAPVPIGADGSRLSLLQSRGATVEIEVTDAETGDAFPSAPLVVHMSPPRSDGLVRPYHYWVNSVCVSNHPLPVAELPFVRSVLPVFLIQLAGAEGGVIVGPGMKHTPHPTGSVGASGGYLKDLDSGDVIAVGEAGVTFGPPVVPINQRSGSASPSGRTPPFSLPSLEERVVDFTRRACSVTIHLGVLHGLSPASSDGAFRVVLSCLTQGWTIVCGETPFSYQALPSGSVRWDTPLVLSKVSSASPRPQLQLTLFEAAGEGRDEMPVASASVELYPMHRTRLARVLPLCFALFDSYSQFDSLEHTCAWSKRALLMISPE